MSTVCPYPVLVRCCTYPEFDSPDRASTNAGPFRHSSRNASCAPPPSHIQHGHVLQGLQLPARMLTGPGLQKPHDLRGDLRGHWVGDWVADGVGTLGCRAPCPSFFCYGAHSLKARRTPPPSTELDSPALLSRRASRDSLNLYRESRGSITRGSTCSGSAWDGLPRRPGGDACLPRTRGSCRRRTSIANRPRPPGCGWRSGPGTSDRAR